MKKTIGIMTLALATTMVTYAQSFKETFDANSLEWTECAYESNSGTAIIDGGKMTIISKGENKGLGIALTALSGVATKVGANTFFETHCYAPLDVQKPFKIRTHVNIQKLASDRTTGLVFNYKDGGNFYCFNFNNEMVRFERHVDGAVVGVIQQGVIWKDKKKVDQERNTNIESSLYAIRIRRFWLLHFWKARISRRRCRIYSAVNSGTISSICK